MLVFFMKEELESISSTIEKYKQKKQIKQKNEQEERKKEKKEQKIFLKRERELSSEKETFYKEILKWRDGFVKTKQFKEIFKLIPFYHHGIKIFGDGWAHKIPHNDEYSCWSQLYLRESGDLVYQAGYKWMGVRTEIVLDGDIKKFSHKYLKNLHKTIKSEKVHENIISELEQKIKWLSLT